MAGKSKYAPLGQRLAASGLERVQLTFEEMKALCGLPETAYTDRRFWGNTWNKGRRQAHSWLSEGYVVDEVCLGNYVIFLRDPRRAQKPGLR